VIKSRRQMGRACSTYRERRGAYRDLVGKPEGRRPLGKSRQRWEAWTGFIWLRIGTGDGLL
jgi:hypothetical protein